MPGTASLAAGEYYAHPRNAFWSIIEALFAIDRALPYAERCAALVSQGIAVWDVLRHCYRPGSLDADIRADTAVPNDIPRLLGDAPGIGRICFNGAAAETLFRRHVLATLTPADARRIECVRLPSTSPAHAAMTVDEKIARWRPCLRGLPIRPDAAR
jgi:hypoxanthine-DNA glycosylase